MMRDDDAVREQNENKISESVNKKSSVDQDDLTVLSELSTEQDGLASFTTDSDQGESPEQFHTISEDGVGRQSDGFETDFQLADSIVIGRYRIDSRLGEGGFGSVYLATDTELHRSVAIKVPHQSRVSTAKQVARFLDEARTIAGLDHPGVVPVYDFGRFDSHCYLVSKFIDGQTLAARIQEETVSVADAVSILRSVAETLEFIHGRGVVHRDIKPQNLLLDATGACFITDFGLALQSNVDDRRKGRIGTYAYMSPEQARGESHLVDNRSDLFSLGVVMYEMLCGQRPFVGEDSRETLDLICNDDPLPLRHRNPQIPKELERISLKLLAKRAASRYRDAQTLAEDLSFFSDGHPKMASASHAALLRQRRIGSADTTKSSDELVGIVPRGLRSFDKEDADFFGQLLPGPCDRTGMPDSLGFWKRRIESTDTTDAFRVGVIYGSSGSGKSSFVRAGLLPLLDSSVTSVAINASDHLTEQRLLQAMRDACSELPASLGLVDSVAWFHSESANLNGRKVLVVIDQFEQWLHAREGKPSAELVLALRQCDGIAIQCLLLVRDDFWVGVSRLADELEIDLVRSSNLAMIDLFDKRHARKVLAEYGRGYNRLPDNLSKLTDDQNRFLDAAIEGLAENEKIVPVQLVTFAEIMKGRTWDVRSLQEVGGTEGVGVQFLDESFGTHAPVQSRIHADAAERVLASLLPDAGTDIKGSMRSERELLEVSGYKSQPRRFNEMIAVLDTQLRLITPADSMDRLDQKSKDAVNESELAERSYQLTHDFLVPAIRRWLQRNQQLTFRGRAKMQLADRADVWNSRPENRHLPSWYEWCSLALLTDHNARNERERRLMNAATRKHIAGTGLMVTLALLLAYMGFQYRGDSRAHSLTRQLGTAKTHEAAGILDQLDGFGSWSEPPLTELASSTVIQSSGGLHARLALLRLHPDDSQLFDRISDRLLRADVQQVPLIRDELAGHPRRQELVDHLWSVVDDPNSKPRQKVNAILVLVAYDPARRDKASRERWNSIASFATNAILKHTLDRPQDYLAIADQLKVGSEPLIGPLLQWFHEPEVSQQRSIASNFLIDFLGSDPARIVEVFLDCDATQVEAFLPTLDEADQVAVETIMLDAIKVSPESESIPEKQQLVSNRQVNAAAYLMRRRRFDQCWDLLRDHSLPNTRSGLIERAVAMETGPNELLRHYNLQTDDSIRSAILLMLGTFESSRLNADQRRRIGLLCKNVFLEARQANLHSAAEWTIRQVNSDSANAKWLDKTIAELSLHPRGKEFQWTVDRSGDTFIRIPRQGYTLELGATELTYGNFLKFKAGHGDSSPESRTRAPTLDCPVILTTWYDAANYCRWRTVQAGMGEEDQCHPEDQGEQSTFQVYEDYASRKGFRLPVPEEWTAACLGKATTRFGWGHDARLIDVYGRPKSKWKVLVPVMEMKPLPSGMFGMFGGVREWCTSRDGDLGRAPMRGGKSEDDISDVIRLTRKGADPMKIQYYTMGFRICRSVPDDDE